GVSAETSGKQSESGLIAGGNIWIVASWLWSWVAGLVIFSGRPQRIGVTKMTFPLEGGCGCRMIRYQMVTAPLFVHCCHCRWCQRESGAAFALNAMIEADRVVHLSAEPEIIDTPSNSGKGQKIARCPKCRVAVWSNYAGAGPVFRFVR